MKGHIYCYFSGFRNLLPPELNNWLKAHEYNIHLGDMGMQKGLTVIKMCVYGAHSFASDRDSVTVMAKIGVYRGEMSFPNRCDIMITPCNNFRLQIYISIFFFASS
jgi:hypothetical protein